MEVWKRPFIEWVLSLETKEHPDWAAALKLLLRGSEQKVIKRWAEKDRTRVGPVYARIYTDVYSRLMPEDVAPCQKWEANLIFLANAFVEFKELTGWETAPAKYRNQHTWRVRKHARELANALEETPRPLYPTAIELFDEEIAAEIIKAMPEEEARYLLGGTRFDPTKLWMLDEDGSPRYLSAAKNLASRFPPQELPAMLRRLAAIAEQKDKEPRRDCKPNQTHPNARAFARHLAEYFQRYYRHTPNHVIAVCVYLKYPELDPPPTEDTIRDWRGAK